MNPLAIRMIQRFEGLRTIAYQCPAGKWTIGYGTTKGVKPFQRITSEQAQQMLEVEVAKLSKKMYSMLTVTLTQYQEAALLSFLYNVGITAFEISTLRKKLNAGDFEGAAEEFPRWDKITKGGVKTKVAGLTNRRNEERRVFLGVLK